MFFAKPISDLSELAILFRSSFFVPVTGGQPLHSRGRLFYAFFCRGRRRLLGLRACAFHCRQNVSVAILADISIVVL